MATATLTVTPAGLHLNLSNRGFTYSNLFTPAVEGEPATDTASRKLNEHGWRVAGEWMQQRNGGVAVYSAHIADATAALTEEP